MTIRKIRESKGLTQKALAKLLNVTRSSVAMWEKGESLPRADKLPMLAEVLQCSIDDLFTHERGERG